MNTIIQKLSSKNKFLFWLTNTKLGHVMYLMIPVTTFIFLLSIYVLILPIFMIAICDVSSFCFAYADNNEKWI